MIAAAPRIVAPTMSAGRQFQLAVCGLHLQGLPLNWQLTDLGARLVKCCRSAPEYRQAH